MIPNGAVVWSGYDGREPCHLVYSDDLTDTGCSCPKEAIDHLRRIGIKVKPSNVYASGISAIRCWWMAGLREVDPCIKDIFSPANNEEATRFLRS